MEKRVQILKVSDIADKIKINPATLETMGDSEIKVNIEYQRGVIYSAEKQASVIESMLKGYAIPSIVLWENEDKTFDVIDGKQRLTSIFLFLSGNLQISDIGDTKKYISEISEDHKEKIRNYEIPFIIMKGTPAEEHYKHELFEILNTTAVGLNKWELLQGTYYGKFLSTFKEEVQNPHNVEIQPEFNFRDKALPANARYAGCYKLLQIYFGSESKIKEYVENHREDSGTVFYNKEIKSILKECSRFPEPKNIEIYFNIMREILDDSEKFRKYNENFDKIVSKLRDFYAENIYTKINGNNLRIVIYNIFGLECGYVSYDPKRNFTSQDREDLYKQYEAKGYLEGNKIRCPRCGKLYSYKDMHIDHIIPHKLGGRTTLENAQFMCSICNPSKGAN